MTDYVLMPEEATPEMEQAAEKYWNDRKFKALSYDPRTWKGLYAAMRAAAPAVQGEPARHDWDEQDKCRRCGDRDWYAGPVCTPKPPAEQQTDVTQLVEALRRSFPLLDDEGLDEDEHHCEWSIQQDRKRLHAIIAPYRKGGDA